MSTSLKSLGIDQLNLSERIELVQEIWESIATEAEPMSWDLSEVQKKEIDRRLAAHESNPNAAIPWEEVEADALARLRQ